MGRSTDRGRSTGAALGVTLVAGVWACSGLPSKTEVLEVVQRDVKEDASCTLPIGILSQIKMQHASKAACVAREGGEKAGACIDALVAFGATKRMPAAYMREWPDDVAADPYERRARELVFRTCVELGPHLREGRFDCGKVNAEKVLEVTKKDATTASVRYQRKVELEKLDAVDVACGAVTRPPGEATVTIEKKESGWSVKAEP